MQEFSAIHASIANAWGQAFSGAGIFSRVLQVAGLAEGASQAV